MSKEDVMAEMTRVPYEDVVSTFAARLEKAGMTGARSLRCAELFAHASRDGVASHGVNRFAAFVGHVREGIVQANAEPVKVAGEGSMERWDGQHGPGPLNAEAAMGRAIELAKTHGLGGVALARTNHWMRAGNYGWQAADAGCIGICWTNATPTMAPWGGKGRVIGNNPLVLAVHRPHGEHLVLDMAMSQYSMGKLDVLERAEEKTEYAAGFDAEGNVTHRPEEVLRGGTAMPIGHWKGSGLALLLDVIATVMTGGMASWEVAQGRADQNVSQIFLAMDPTTVGTSHGQMHEVVGRIMETVHASGEGVLYPGERAMATRRESLELGVLVDRERWEEILHL